MEAYCSSCGAEVEAYELIECVSCEQYFCEDCIDEGDMCFACTRRPFGAWYPPTPLPIES